MSRIKPRTLKKQAITSRPVSQKTIKMVIFDMFLKYQYTICVQTNPPLTHLIPLCLLTCIFNSLYHLSIYIISIIYILSTLYLSEKFPDSFGARYLSFLKRNSSTEAFEKYCGNPWGAIKAAINNPEFIKVVAKNGGSKVVAGVGGCLAAEHVLHKAKVGQIYEYKMKEYFNSDNKQTQVEVFDFKPNGPSILEKMVGRDSGK